MYYSPLTQFLIGVLHVAEISAILVGAFWPGGPNWALMGAGIAVGAVGGGILGGLSATRRDRDAETRDWLYYLRERDI